MPKVATDRLPIPLDRTKPCTQITGLDPGGHNHSMNQTPAVRIEGGATFPIIKILTVFMVESYGVIPGEQQVQHVTFGSPIFYID